VQKLRVHNISVSLDGYVTGLNHARESDSDDGVDKDFAEAGDMNIGATIMGRNVFGAIRGKSDEDRKEWRGDMRRHHGPVFVLTDDAPEPVEISSSTTFNFVTDGIEAALGQAFEAANGADVRIAGGASTIQQFLHARLVDEMHFVIVPSLVGAGERLFDNLDGAIAGYECVGLMPSPSGVVHVRIARSPTGGG
jgi:dihydrofolate reductase